jgi:quinol monooxygenase YgiN
MPGEPKGARCSMKRTNETGIIAAAVLAACVTAAVLAFPAPALAQGQGQGDPVRTREALARTDEVIAQAKGIVSESRSEKGRVSLDVASGMQTSAWSNYQSRGYTMAGKLTMRAREEALHAIALARSDNQSEQNVNRTSEETAERIARLRDALAESGIRDEQAAKLIEEARGLLDKSRTNSQQLRYQLAQKLANDARDTAIRAEERIKSIRTVQETSERRLALLERLVERARERLGAGGDARYREELDTAARQLDRAKALLGEARYREAREALDTCEKTLRSAVRLAPPAPASELTLQMEEALRLLERANEMTQEGGAPADPKTVETLTRAREALRRADEALAAARPEEARSLILGAREMLQAAVQGESGALTRERVEARIARIETLGEQTGSLVASCSAPGVQELMERAAGHVKLARERVEASRLDEAQAEATIAENMYQRITEICAR